MLGVAGRLGWADTPVELQRTWVLVLFGVLYAVEFLVDKVPWLDSAWDAVHTVVRPVGGALLGVALAQDAGSSEVLAGLVGGGFSLTAHGAKATTRATANVSPEPFSNIALSLGEDGLVAGLMALALSYPVAAGAVAMVLAIASVVVCWSFARALRQLRRRWLGWWARHRGGEGASP